ncbi:MAG: oxidoreductase, partial [Candidatus Eremiobacteraeota bacterium]|nr:oxidoreductase [Candidatus Eremiobacteraeota bacterium]
RFPLELFRAVRDVWPHNKPLGVRLSATDHADNGWALEDAIAFAALLRDEGCDFVDVSSGGLVPHQRIEVHTAYQAPYSAAIRRNADIRTIAVGKIDTPEVAEAIVANGDADMVALARGFLRHPRFVWDAADRFGDPSFTPDQYLRARSRAPR